MAQHRSSDFLVISPYRSLRRINCSLHSACNAAPPYLLSLLVPGTCTAVLNPLQVANPQSLCTEALLVAYVPEFSRFISTGSPTPRAYLVILLNWQGPCTASLSLESHIYSLVFLLASTSLNSKPLISRDYRANATLYCRVQCRRP